MKKLFLMVGVVLALMTPVFAQSVNSEAPAATNVSDEKAAPKDYFFFRKGSPEYESARNLISENLTGNKDAIVELSGKLSDVEKAELYDEYSRAAGGYAAMNFFVGFGSGSFVQRDKKGGLTQLGLELGGLGLTYVGVLIESLPVAYAGVGCLAVCGIYGIARPIYYSKKHNAELKESLGLPVENISFTPVIDPMNKNYGLIAKISL